MSKKILVFNTGSSTLKYKLFETSDSDVTMIKTGMVQGIGQETGPKNHQIALSILFQGFGFNLPTLANIEGLIAIGHRVVHGGNEFNKTTLLNEAIVTKLCQYNLLAPQHNPHVLEVIKNILKHSGIQGHRDIPNYAVFDTSFYKNLPEVTKIYPLPYEYYSDEGIQRFGFHGISHQHAVNEVMKKYPDAKKIISIHLGGGASMTATKNGEPIETSMGFTPIEGLMMTSRPGDIDPGIIHYLIEKKIIKHSEVNELLNYHCGLFGITDGISDMREILFLADLKMEDPDYKPYSVKEYLSDDKKKRIKLAIDMFVYRIKKYIGSYYAILGGCDVLVFTGRMGSGSSVIREMTMDGLEFMFRDCKIEVVESDEEKEIALEIMRNLK